MNEDRAILRAHLWCTGWRFAWTVLGIVLMLRAGTGEQVVYVCYAPWVALFLAAELTVWRKVDRAYEAWRRRNRP